MFEGIVSAQIEDAIENAPHEGNAVSAIKSERTIGFGNLSQNIDHAGVLAAMRWCARGVGVSWLLLLYMRRSSSRRGRRR